MLVCNYKNAIRELIDGNEKYDTIAAMQFNYYLLLVKKYDKIFIA